MKGDVVAKKTLQLALGVAKWRIAVMEEAKNQYCRKKSPKNIYKFNNGIDNKKIKWYTIWIL